MIFGTSSSLGNWVIEPTLPMICVLKALSCKYNIKHSKHNHIIKPPDINKIKKYQLPYPIYCIVDGGTYDPFLLICEFFPICSNQELLQCRKKTSIINQLFSLMILFNRHLLFLLIWDPNKLQKNTRILRGLPEGELSMPVTT